MNGNRETWNDEPKEAFLGHWTAFSCFLHRIWIFVVWSFDLHIPRFFPYYILKSTSSITNIQRIMTPDYP